MLERARPRIARSGVVVRTLISDLRVYVEVRPQLRHESRSVLHKRASVLIVNCIERQIRAQSDQRAAHCIMASRRQRVDPSARHLRMCCHPCGSICSLLLCRTRRRASRSRPTSGRPAACSSTVAKTSSLQVGATPTDISLVWPAQLSQRQRLYGRGQAW